MFLTTYDDITKTWRGPIKAPLYNKDVTLGRLLLSALERDPNKIGQISANNNIQYTNGEIHLMSIRAAQNLTKSGFANSGFAFITKNSHHLAPLVIAAFTINSSICPIDPNYKKGELAAMFKIIEPKVIFCDSFNRLEVKKAINELNLNVPVYIVDGIAQDGETISVEILFEKTGSEHYFTPPLIEDGEKEIAAIMCSSGSTGLSKGILLSHANVINQMDFFQLTADDILLSNSALFWVSGMVTLLQGIRNGATRVITTSDFSSDLMLDLIEKYKITLMMTAPMAVVSVLQNPNIKTRDLSSIKHIIVGGGPLHEQFSQQLTKYLPNGKVCLSYGFTEVFGGIVANYTGDPKYFPSVGQAVENFKFKIVNENGKCLGIGEKGEILVKPMHKVLGYCKNKEATKEIMTEDGYVRSGDIGYFDMNGFFYFIERIKEVFKYKNNLIFPKEIETVIVKDKNVANVCVVGVPDTVCGDLPAAAIIRKDNKLTEEDICNMVKESLSDSKQLRGGVYFLDSMPTTGSGKLLRREVRKIIIEKFSKIK